MQARGRTPTRARASRAGSGLVRKLQTPILAMMNGASGTAGGGGALGNGAGSGPATVGNATQPVDNAPLAPSDEALLRERVELLREMSVDDHAAMLGGALLICTQAEAEVLAPALLELMLREQGGSANAALVAAAARAPAASGVATSGPQHGAEASRPQTQEEVVQALRVKYGLASSQPEKRVDWTVRLATLRSHWREVPATLWTKARDGVLALATGTPRRAEVPSDAPRVALVRAWHRLPESVRAAALAADSDARRWRAAAVATIQASTHERGVAQFVIDRGDPSMADLLVGPLQQAGTASAAQHALLALAWLAQARRDPEWMTLALQGEGLLPAPNWRGWASPQNRDPLEAQRVLDGVLAGALDPRLGNPRNPNARTARGVLLAGLVWLDPSRLSHAQLAQTLRVLTDTSHPALAELGAVLRSSRTPIARLRALQWLGVEHLAGVLGHAATARLSVSHGPADQEAVLQAAHLALRPRRSAALRRVIVRGARGLSREASRSTSAAKSSAPRVSKPIVADRFAAATPRQGDLHVLTGTARRMLPTWTRAISMDAPTRDAALAPLLLDEDPSVRLACVRRGAGSLTRDLLFDANKLVSRSAMLRTIDDQESRSRLSRSHQWPGSLAEDLRALHRSPHRSVASMSLREARALGDWTQDSPAGRLAALRQLGEDRGATIASLREALSGSNPALLAGALRVVRLLRVWNDVEEPLIRLAMRTGPVDARTAATAVALLGHASGEPARKLVAACLAHSEARVRANAVEGITRAAAQGQVAIATIAELKGDAHHRVRANAIRGELAVLLRGTMGSETSNLGVQRETRSGSSTAQHLNSNLSANLAAAWRDELRTMLTHDSPMHRLAGVWLASRTIGWFADSPTASAVAEVGQRLVELAQFDVDPRVRRRATVSARCPASVGSLVPTGKDVAHA